MSGTEQRGGSPPPVDFAALRRRLLEAEAKLAGPPSGKIEELLRARARALAQEETRAEGPPALALLRIDAGGTPVALELPHVREVLEIPALVPLPGVPPFVRGIFAVRGEVFSAVDLPLFLAALQGAPPPPPHAGPTRVVMAEHGHAQVGLLAGPAVELLEVPLDALTPIEGPLAEVTRGRLWDGTLLLDGPRLLAHPRFLVG